MLSLFLNFLKLNKLDLFIGMTLSFDHELFLGGVVSKRKFLFFNLLLVKSVIISP